jgi:hypothetical protein
MCQLKREEDADRFMQDMQTPAARMLLATIAGMKRHSQNASGAPHPVYGLQKP